MTFHLLFAALTFASCALPTDTSVFPIVPAAEFSKQARQGTLGDFSMSSTLHATRDGYPAPVAPAPAALHYVDGDPRYLEQGFTLKDSIAVPSEQIVNPNGTGHPGAQGQGREQVLAPRERRPLERASLGYTPPPIPPGSSAPYLAGQMTPNPSLWPDEAQGASLFRDLRAFQSLDLITIIIDESSEGRKKAETDAESKFSLTAAISNFFGIETKSWASNNEALDPSNLLNATTDSKFEGDGETTREGELKARISAIIMEVLPNGLLRIEGTKIVSVNSEEEIMVISGLVRQPDVDAFNQISSSRIANMRIDFYGRGVVAENQQPGWLARIIRNIWPF